MSLYLREKAVMKFCILLTGLSGSGKTTLAKKIVYECGGTHFNADTVRAKHNDWDFSVGGRDRQVKRMVELKERTEGLIVLDFICPKESSRKFINADLTIFLDTVTSSKYLDTDKVYEKPINPDFHLKEWSETEMVLSAIKKIELALKSKG
ncbi:MAG: adenylyl-sulfate kinase [Deltaproteobacteria bacterium]|nr:adenylyl-sulfate kinase [Deltaproteobacteria bacterium]